MFEKNQFAIIGKIIPKTPQQYFPFQKKITFIDFIGKKRRIWTPVSESGAVVAIQRWISSVQIHASICNKYILSVIHWLWKFAPVLKVVIIMFICSWNILSHFIYLTIMIHFCAKKYFIIFLLGVICCLFIL